MPTIASYVHILIIRVWTEPRDEDSLPRLWRYNIEDVKSSRQFFFGSLEEAMQFLADRMKEQKQSDGICQPEEPRSQ